MPTPGSPGREPPSSTQYGPVDSALLHAFEVEKECYEFTYAATYLPEWMPVAEGGMRWLLEHAHE